MAFGLDVVEDRRVFGGNTVLVTGATGFIGRRFIRPGERALVRRPSGVNNEVIGDLLDPGSLARACEGVENVYHCAGEAEASSVADERHLRQVNVEGTRNLLQAAGRAGVRRFVYLSSVKAIAEPGDVCADDDWPGVPTTPYGQSKRAAEEAVLDAGAKFGMHVVVLRLAMVYGRGSRGNLWRLARLLRHGWFPCLPATGNRRSLVHVQDVVEAMRLVAVRPEAHGRTYIIAEPRAYSGRELCEGIRTVLGVRSSRWTAPAWALRGAGRMGDGLGRLLGRPLPVRSELISRLLDSAWYSPARIEHELGWRARVSLADGLREMFVGDVPCNLGDGGQR